MKAYQDNRNTSRRMMYCMCCMDKNTVCWYAHNHI